MTQSSEARTRSHAYLTALTVEIEKKLQRAVANPTQMRNLLQELFADIALEVDDRAKEIILIRGKDEVSPEADGPLCFYDVLSDHFVSLPEDGRPILDLIVQLWSQSFATHIFSLLFHKWFFRPSDHANSLMADLAPIREYIRIKLTPCIPRPSDHAKSLMADLAPIREYIWIKLTPSNDLWFTILRLLRNLCPNQNGGSLFISGVSLISCIALQLFEVQIESSEVLLRYSSALVQGATNVFWMDIQTNTKRFQSLFYYLLEYVALDQTRLAKIAIQAQRDLFLLLSRFIFYYNSVDKLPSFLGQFPTFPNSFLIGGPADIFVNEVTDQLQKLKVEPVLLHYFSQIKILQGLELRMTTSTRLKACLYSFTSPGGPMYPTRAVRHAAWDALDSLFPVGQYPRHLISLFFRLLYPWYWPSSCWNFLVSCIKAVFYSLLNILFSSWDRLKRPKTS